MNKPKRSLVGKVVRIRWRDSFQGDLEEDINDLEDDVIWSCVGEVVRESELFLTISYGTREERPQHVHSPLSVPWTQILSLKELREV